MLSNEVHSETLSQGASQLPEVELANFFFIKQTFWNFLIELLVTLIDIQSKVCLLKALIVFNMSRGQGCGSTLVNTIFS